MPGIRKNPTTLEQSGAYDRNPARRKTEATTSSNVGKPPKHFTPELKKIWVELLASVPSGILQDADRFIIEIAAKLMHTQRTNPLMKAAELSLLVSCLSKLGMSPYDRSKVAQTAAPTSDEANPFNEFV